MPKKIECSHIVCGGREYEGLGFNNNTTHAEFVHNDGYQSDSSDRAHFVEAGVVYPGTRRKPIKGFD